MVRVRGRPFCIGRLWQGVEARFRGLTPIPYLLRRFRVYDGFVFSAGGGFVPSVLFRLRRRVFPAVVSFLLN